MLTPTPTQADKLPPFQPIKIPTLNDPTTIWGFKHWLREVQLALTNLSLLGVISQEIERPARNHLHYENWLKWSRFVGQWLLSNVGKSNAAIVRSIYPDLQFADEVYYRIGRLQLAEEEITREEQLRHLCAMTPYQFDSLYGYLSAWGAHAMVCAQFDPKFNWFAATKMILREVQAELPDLCNFIHYQVRTQDTTHLEGWRYRWRHWLSSGLDEGEGGRDYHGDVEGYVGHGPFICDIWESPLA
ncbi:hypothetical protein VN97_g4451 [Penicillium thymicola]|uniref:Uncharacterized protein n=1 Tax=Penicillium thymicola TaxID=293382 RepID=A0AAI9X9X5_PENTH|nr:hypothetical protein VN97_g4451 [Penicillium thymicola]